MTKSYFHLHCTESAKMQKEWEDGEGALGVNAAPIATKENEFLVEGNFGVEVRIPLRVFS
jgi:hypothetical protein